MAMFHLSTKPIKRSDGRSATASAAYRAAEKIYDARTGLTHDYSKKSGVVETNCFMVNDNKIIKLDRSELWNTAESAEKRKDGRTAREIIINLPDELTKEQRALLVYDFTKDIAKKYNVAIDYAIHLPDKHGDQRNHHCHIMMTTRVATLENNEFKLGKKTNIELSNTALAKLDQPKTQEQITALRQHWAKTANKHLAHAKIDATIDHRSNADRNISAIPTIKLGWEASALERKGIATVKGDINRAIRIDNKLLDDLEFEISFLHDALDIERQEAEQYDRLAFEQAQAAEHVEYAPAPAPTPRPRVEPELIEYKDLRLANDSDTSRYYTLMHMHDDAVKTPQDEYFARFIDEKSRKFDAQVEQFRQSLSRNMSSASNSEQDDMKLAFDEVNKLKSNIKNYQNDYQKDKALERAELESKPDIVTQPHNTTAAPQPDPEPYSTPYDRPSSPWDR